MTHRWIFFLFLFFPSTKTREKERKKRSSSFTWTTTLEHTWRGDEEGEEDFAQVPMLITMTVFNWSEKMIIISHSSQHRWWWWKPVEASSTFLFFPSPPFADVHSVSGSWSTSMMNNSSAIIDRFYYLDIAQYPLIFFLSCFCLLTVIGNGLVIYAVVQERYLKSGLCDNRLGSAPSWDRTPLRESFSDRIFLHHLLSRLRLLVTYYYMASLACADLFVGLVVMPFAIVQVIYGDYWPFGKTSCDLWHSIDVCASTASILDLCVIALDRYSAITNPISYHRAFFVKRWPYLLLAVWLCSGKFVSSVRAHRWPTDSI